MGKLRLEWTILFGTLNRSSGGKVTPLIYKICNQSWQLRIQRLFCEHSDSQLGLRLCAGIIITTISIGCCYSVIFSYQLSFYIFSDTLKYFNIDESNEKPSVIKVELVARLHHGRSIRIMRPGQDVFNQ